MGCFFGCFRLKEDRKTHLISKSISSRNRDPFVTKNKLASALLCEEKGSPCEKAVHLSLQENFDRESADEELKHEAKFLKSCGALLETPAEIRKASEKTIVQTSNDDGVPSNFHSRLPDTSCKKLHWDEQPDQISVVPAKVHENSGLPENKSGGCHSEEHQTLRKVVRFEGVEHVSGIESGVESVNLDVSPQTENQIQPLGSNGSPYPTPLNLTEEMQTPGTLCPSKLENLRTGKNARIRTQYVYPVLNPVENLSQWKALRQGDSQLLPSSDQFEQKMGSSSPHGEENSQQISLTPVPKDSSPNDKRSQNQESISKEEVNFNQDTTKLVVLSLSQWLKPPPPKDERWNTKIVMRERSHSEKSPDADRPIIGIVAAHWNDDVPSRVSPKGFDGNGIPNSTNKYKEDQKVSWHATPFEERLEKALSDEKLFPQRKLIGRPMELED